MIQDFPLMDRFFVWFTGYDDGGSYVVNVSVSDPSGGVVSQEVSVVVLDVPLPDFAVLSAKVIGGSSFRVGEIVTFEFFVKNVGEVASDLVSWVFYPQGRFGGGLLSYGPFRLERNAGVYIYPYTNYSSIGTYSPFFVVDEGVVTPERNESNNNVSLVISVE